MSRQLPFRAGLLIVAVSVLAPHHQLNYQSVIFSLLAADCFYHRSSFHGFYVRRHFCHYRQCTFAAAALVLVMTVVVWKKLEPSSFPLWRIVFWEIWEAETPSQLATLQMLPNHDYQQPSVAIWRPACIGTIRTPGQWGSC